MGGKCAPSGAANGAVHAYSAPDGESNGDCTDRYHATRRHADIGATGESSGAGRRHSDGDVYRFANADGNAIRERSRYRYRCRFENSGEWQSNRATGIRYSFRDLYTTTDRSRHARNTGCRRRLAN